MAAGRLHGLFVSPLFIRPSRREVLQCLYGNRHPDATDGNLSDSTMPHLNRRARPNCHSGNSRNPESFVQFLIGPIKDSGLRIQSGVAIERLRGGTNPRRLVRLPSVATGPGKLKHAAALTVTVTVDYAYLKIRQRVAVEGGGDAGGQVVGQGRGGAVGFGA